MPLSTSCRFFQSSPSAVYGTQIGGSVGARCTERGARLASVGPHLRSHIVCWVCRSDALFRTVFSRMESDVDLPLSRLVPQFRLHGERSQRRSSVASCQDASYPQFTSNMVADSSALSPMHLRAHLQAQFFPGVSSVLSCQQQHPGQSSTLSNPASIVISATTTHLRRLRAPKKSASSGGTCHQPSLGSRLACCSSFWHQQPEHWSETHAWSADITTAETDHQG